MKTTLRSGSIFGAVLLLACGGAGPAPEARAGRLGEAPASSRAPPSGDAPAPSGEPSADLPERLELLAGRLRIRGPKGAKVAARPHGIMAAEASEDDETRVILVPGEGQVARFVLLAQESYAIGTGDVEKDAPKLLGEEIRELTLVPAKVGPGLAAVALRPKSEVVGQGALLVLGAVVERADRSLCVLSFHVLPSMASERAAWEAKAKDVLGTLEAGSGGSVGSRSHRLPTGTGKVLIVDLPRPAVMSRQKGPDFFVYHLRELTAVGTPPLDVGVYVGDHPAYHHERTGVRQPKIDKSPGTLAGKKVEWFTWTVKHETTTEAIAPLGTDGKAHVFAKGPSAAVADFRRAAGAMRLERE